MCIALSHWCIFHRSKAELVVATWDKQFHSSQLVQKVPLLYLANDILQNSKRKGTEFVTEFWKVLPAALKDVVENGDDSGKNVVSRLVSYSWITIFFLRFILLHLVINWDGDAFSSYWAFNSSYILILPDSIC